MQSLSSFRKPPCNKTVGIEWECFLSDKNYKSIGAFYGFFYCTSDGSIITDSNTYGREFVSQPLQPKWLVKELARFYKKEFKEPFLWNDSCGIHVHVSRMWATKSRVLCLQEFMSELSRDEYLEAFGRHNNTYNIHQSDQNTTHRTRYLALNNDNEHTIEFRVFRSGDLKWAQYCVLLVEYMVENAKHLNKDAFFAFVDMHKPV
jgi:hypothetical protein